MSFFLCHLPDDVAFERNDHASRVNIPVVNGYFSFSLTGGVAFICLRRSVRLFVLNQAISCIVHSGTTATRQEVELAVGSRQQHGHCLKNFVLSTAGAWWKLPEQSCQEYEPLQLARCYNAVCHTVKSRLITTSKFWK